MHQQVALALLAGKKALKRGELAEVTGLSTRKLTSILHQVEDAGAIRRLTAGGFRADKNLDMYRDSTAVSEAQHPITVRAKERLQQMRYDADTRTCRREGLPTYVSCEAKKPEVAVQGNTGRRCEVA